LQYTEYPSPSSSTTSLAATDGVPGATKLVATGIASLAGLFLFRIVLGDVVDDPEAEIEGEDNPVGGFASRILKGEDGDLGEDRAAEEEEDDECGGFRWVSVSVSASCEGEIIEALL
jgi:hypothetical protein